ncbi:MAG: CBASS cGAMP synthase [Colwellia sp.]|jgi:hypothetical protein
MKWSINSYLANESEGLISLLELTAAQKTYLRSLKDASRLRTREVFKEAKDIIRSAGFGTVDVNTLRSSIKQGELRFLSDDEQISILNLMIEMTDIQRKAFLSTSPRFWVQGSFTYNTLNQPYSKPPQQMDIDDGTYMPMDMFEDQPRLGHKLLMLLVDASVKSLANELGGIADTNKTTCSRLIIKDKDVHLDVPMYAIPLAEFEKREVAMNKSAGTFDSVTANEALFESKSINLDPDSVYLAIRGAEMWKKSDPKSVADWFNASVKRHGVVLRDICRYLKAWRDVQWDSNGPSSICLMKCVVDSFDSTIMPDSGDRGDYLWRVVNNLPNQLQASVESPDLLDRESGHKLFPQKSMGEADCQDVIDKASELKDLLAEALDANTIKESFSLLEKLFGKRVINQSLIKSVAVGQAYVKDPAINEKKQLQSDMRSG